jgi:uncharacterized protein
LRYDKRTFAFPRTYKGTLDSEAIDDAVDAVRWVGARPEADARSVFVLGHSLGGLAVAYVAQRVPVAGLILMAAAGRPMDLVIRQQVQTLNAGTSEAELAATLKQQDAIMAKVRAGTATAADVGGALPPEALRDMIVRDPLAELRNTPVPLLVLRGEKDAQVFQADFDALAALAATRPGSAARQFPSLTHIFTASEGPPVFRAIFAPAAVSSAVLDAIAAWVTKTSHVRI